MTDNPTPMTDAEVGRVMQDYHREVAGKHTAQMQALVDGENARDLSVAEGETARNAQVDAKMASVDPALLNHAIMRLSNNQYGNLNAGGFLEGWYKNNSFDLSVTYVRTIASGVPFADRPIEDQEVLHAIGRGSETMGQHFAPSINIMRMDWSGAAGNPHTIYPGSVRVGGNYCTVASVARLLSGTVGGEFLQGVTSDWGVCGSTFECLPGYYHHAHPRVTSESGSVEFFWPAVVSGVVDLSRDAPRWGFYPSPYGVNNSDVTI